MKKKEMKLFACEKVEKKTNEKLNKLLRKLKIYTERKADIL